VFINTCFEHRTRTAAELRSCVGPACCAAIAAELPAVCERFAIMLARLAAAGDGSVVLLPSSEIMDATHAPWIRRIAGWCEGWPQMICGTNNWKGLLVSTAEEVASALAGALNGAFEVGGCMATVAEFASGFTLITPESVFPGNLQQ
jgi:hypothetical protein